MNILSNRPPIRTTLALITCLSLAACGGGSGTPEAAALQTAAAGVVSVPASAAERSLKRLFVPPTAQARTTTETLAGGTGGASATSSKSAIESALLGSAMAANLLPFAELEIPGLEHIRAFSDDSGGFVGLRNFFGQPLKNNGVRAEISVDVPYVEGDTVRYSWRFGITDDFRSDAPDNRWWLFADWHDQPDLNLGQTWDGFAGRSPPVALGFGQIDGQDFLALVYGSPEPTTRALLPFRRGVWNRIGLEITWSRGAGGRVAVYMNDSTTPVQVMNGPNMHNAYQHYFKLGSYRNPNIKSDTWVYVRDLQIEKLAP